MLLNSMMAAVVLATVAPRVRRDCREAGDGKSCAGTEQETAWDHVTSRPYRSVDSAQSEENVATGGARERDERSVATQEGAGQSDITDAERLLVLHKPRFTITRGARGQLDTPDTIRTRPPLRYHQTLGENGQKANRSRKPTIRHENTTKMDPVFDNEHTKKLTGKRVQWTRKKRLQFMRRSAATRREEPTPQNATESEEYYVNDEATTRKDYDSIERERIIIKTEDDIATKHDAFIKKENTIQNIEDANIKKQYEIIKKVYVNITEDSDGNLTNKDLLKNTYEGVTSNNPKMVGDSNIDTQENSPTISNKIKPNTSTTKLIKSNIYESNPLKTLGREADKSRDKIHINTGPREITEHFQPIYTTDEIYESKAIVDSNAYEDAIKIFLPNKISRQANIESTRQGNNDGLNNVDNTTNISNTTDINDKTDVNNNTKLNNKRGDCRFRPPTLLKALVYAVTDMQQEEGVPKHPADMLLLANTKEYLDDLWDNIVDKTKAFG